MSEPVAIGAGVFAFGIVALLVWAILRAARYQPQAMLVVVLGIIAVLSILGYLATIGPETDLGELLTIAGTAVGALAGGLTTLLRPTDGPGGPQAQETAPAPIEPQRPATAATEDQEDDG